MWSRCGYPSGDHAWELLPNAAALFYKTCWVFWFLIKSRIYKLARTLSCRQRRVRLTGRLKIGPNCSPVETNLCFISSDKTSQDFPVLSLQIDHKPNHLRDFLQKRVLTPRFLLPLWVPGHGPGAAVAPVAFSPLPFCLKSASSGELLAV